MDNLRVLVVEDNPGDVALIRLALTDGDNDPAIVFAAPTLAEGLREIATRGFDVVLLDLSLPDVTGIDTLARVQSVAPSLPVVVLTGTENEELAAAAVRAGAQDYLVKRDLSGGALRRAVRHAIERKAAASARAANPAILADVRRHLEILAAEHRALERVLSLAGGAPATVAPVAFALAPGALVADRYRIERPLGKGAMGATFLARDETLGRLVCLKVLHHHRARDATVVADFLREARTAARLSHVNVVRVYDFGYAGELPFLVLEYAERGSLADLLAEQGAVAATRARKLAACILDGLAYIHARGIVHGDLKPHNVLIDHDGEPKIADFGLARDSTSDSPLTTRFGLDTPSLPRGTPAYMSPEIVRGATPSIASDLYAVGAMLHEIVSGETYLDFTGLDAAALRRAILTEAPRPLPASLDAALRAAVARSLVKEPAGRFASAAGMRNALVATSTLAEHEQ